MTPRPYVPTLKDPTCAAVSEDMRVMGGYVEVKMISSSHSSGILKLNNKGYLDQSGCERVLLRPEKDYNNWSVYSIQTQRIRFSG